MLHFEKNEQRYGEQQKGQNHADKEVECIQCFHNANRVHILAAEVLLIGEGVHRNELGLISVVENVINAIGAHTDTARPQRMPTQR